MAYPTYSLRRRCPSIGRWLYTTFTVDGAEVRFSQQRYQSLEPGAFYRRAYTLGDARNIYRDCLADGWEPC